DTRRDIGLLWVELTAGAWADTARKGWIRGEVGDGIRLGVRVGESPGQAANPRSDLASADTHLIQAENPLVHAASVADGRRVQVRDGRPQFAQNRAVGQGTRTKQRSELCEASGALIDNGDLVQHRMLHVAHLDAVSGQPPVAGAGGSRSSCYCAAGLAQPVEQQYRLRRIADRGGCREQLLGLLEGRGEDLTALTPGRMAR